MKALVESLIVFAVVFLAIYLTDYRASERYVRRILLLPLFLLFPQSVMADDTNVIIYAGTNSRIARYAEPSDTTPVEIIYTGEHGEPAIFMNIPVDTTFYFKVEHGDNLLPMRKLKVKDGLNKHVVPLP